MADTLDPKNVDKRIYERLLQNGQLDEKTYEKFLKALPDVTEKSSPVSTVMGTDEDEDDDSDDETVLAGDAPQA
jgi:hypothetical protein